MTTTDIAKAANTLPSEDMLDTMLEDAGEGTSFSPDEMLIPYVRLAQSLSPQLNKKKPEYIEGLSNGDAYNNVTGEFWPGEEGLKVIPCYQVTKWFEFIPRASGGGLVGEIHPNDPVLQQTQRDGGAEVLPNGNELVKSDQHYCLIIGDDGMYQPVVVDMKSTQLKVSRRWKTQISMRKIKHPSTGRLLTPPLYASIWHLRSVEESNDKGDFFNWSVTYDSMVSDADLYAEAKLFRKSVEDGLVRAQEDTPPPSDLSGSAGSHMGGAAHTDDDIPF